MTQGGGGRDLNTHTPYTPNRHVSALAVTRTLVRVREDTISDHHTPQRVTHNTIGGWMPREIAYGLYTVVSGFVPFGDERETSNCVQIILDRDCKTDSP